MGVYTGVLVEIGLDEAKSSDRLILVSESSVRMGLISLYGNGSVRIAVALSNMLC